MKNKYFTLSMKQQTFDAKLKSANTVSIKYKLFGCLNSPQLLQDRNKQINDEQFLQTLTRYTLIQSLVGLTTRELKLVEYYSNFYTPV